MFSLNVKWRLHKASTADSLIFIYFMLNNVLRSGSFVQDASTIITSPFVKHRLFVKRVTLTMCGTLCA